VCDFARQITPPLNQHARFPLADSKVTDAANRSLTRITARASTARDVGTTAGEGEVAGAPVEPLALGDRDGAGAAVDAGPPEVQPARRPTLIRTTVARWRLLVPTLKFVASRSWQCPSGTSTSSPFPPKVATPLPRGKPGAKPPVPVLDW
jgi:hypothetical protein